MGKGRKVIIKQREASWSSGMGLNNAYTTKGDKSDRKPLEAHSTIKGAFNRYTLRKGPDNRWLTGIDPEAAEFKRIQDPKLKEKKIKKAEEDLERLERITGFKLDALSDHWLNFSIKLVQQQGDTELNLDDPDHELQYLGGLASRLFAPSEDDLNNEDYNHCRFYVYNGEEVVSRQKSNKLLRREIIFTLFNYKDNKERLYFIAKTADIVANRSMSAEDIFHILSDYADTAPVSVLEQFKDVVKREPKELQITVRVKEAIERDIIRFNSASKTMIFLGKQVGRNADTAIDFFSRKENEHIFAQLEEALEEQE